MSADQAGPLIIEGLAMSGGLLGDGWGDHFGDALGEPVGYPWGRLGVAFGRWKKQVSRHAG